jgi:hypothetical protein
MARIPTPALSGQEVGSVRGRAVAQPFQNLQTSADMFGAAQGRALQQASEGLNNAADQLVQMAKEDDSNSLLKTQSEAMTFSQDLVNNPVDGFLTRKGEAAVGATSEALSKFDAWAAGLPAASTQSGKLAQQNFIARQKASMFQTLSSHERTEKVGATKKNLAAVISSAERDAQLNYRNPTALADNEKIVFENTGRLSDTEGLGAEAREALQKAAVSKLYVGVLQRMLSDPGNSIAARELYNELTQKQKLEPGKQFNAITSALLKVETDDQGMRLGMKAQVLHPDDPAAAAAYILNQNVPTEIKTAAFTFADQQNARVQRAEAQELRNIAQEQSNNASIGHPLNEADLMRLPVPQQDAIRAIHRRITSSTPTASDPAAYREFYSMTPEQRGAISEEDFITKYWDKFSETDRRTAASSYGTGRAAAGRAEASLEAAKGKALTAEQTKLNTYFEKQVKGAITQRYPTSNMSPTNKRRAAALASQLRSNFTNRLYSADSPFSTSADIDEFLQEQFLKVDDAYIAFAANPPKFGTGDKIIDITDFKETSAPELTSLNNADFSFVAQAYMNTLSSSDPQITKNTIDTKKFKEYILGQLEPKSKDPRIEASATRALIAAGRDTRGLNLEREYRRRALQLLINRGNRNKARAKATVDPLDDIGM